MAKGKLIVIEGTDGSGKKTQTAKLLERLLAEGARFASGETSLFKFETPESDESTDKTLLRFSSCSPQLASLSSDSALSQEALNLNERNISLIEVSQRIADAKAKQVPVQAVDFPRYGTPSCYLVEKYLHGGFGSALEVGPYVASMFYAVDRYDHSFDMKAKLDAGAILISDRYVSANMGHQAGKIDNLAERDRYLEWVSDLEYDIFKIPRPDLTILLYVDPIINQRLMSTRPDKEYLKGKRQDIHEADFEHLRKASEAFLYVAKKFGWTVIDCAPKTDEHPEGVLLPVEEIHKLVWKEVENLLNVPVTPLVGTVEAGKVRP